MSTDAPFPLAASEPDVVRFIPEQISESDRFQHKAVARVLARAIVRHAHLRTIGLLGKWGSGKSTTIGFLPEAVESQSGQPCLLFTYDAWLYQSDAPRPAFIDALFEFLVAEGRLKRDAWNDHIAMLTGHLQVTYASERPFTSLTSRLMLVAALGSPLAVLVTNHHALISARWPAWSEGRLAVLAAGLVVLPVLVWGVGQLLRPLIAAARRCAAWVELRRSTSEREIQEDAAASSKPPASVLDPRFVPKPTNESWSWILSRKPQATEQRKVGKAVPSSADFQSAFHAMVVAALQAQDDGARLVIAVDNLDRLPVAEAVALWAVIRGFFLGVTAAQSALLERLTIVLPMDDQYVVRIQGETDQQPADPKLAQGLLEKTFDLTLRLPQPAFVDWQSYFVQQLAHAFYRSENDEEVCNIGTVLNQAWSPKADQITPRMINALVNRIVAMWLRWEADRIDLMVIAYYVIHQTDIDHDLIGALSRPNILVGNVPDAWQSWIAAMHFGIPPQAAIELLLTAAIVEAIQEHDRAEFNGLAQFTAFPELLRSIVESYDSSTPDIIVLQAAELVAEGPGMGRIVQAHVNGVLARAYLSSQPSGQMDRRHVPGLKALFGVSAVGVGPHEVVERTIDKLWHDQSPSPHRHEVLEAFMGTTTPARDGLGQAQPCVVNGYGGHFFELAGTVQEYPEWIACLRTTADAAILEDLIKRLERPDDGAQALAIVRRSAVRGSWKPVVDALIEAFHGRRSIPIETVALGFGILRRTEPDIRAAITDPSVSRLSTHISTTYNADQLTALARLLALALLEDDMPIPGHAWTGRHTAGLVDALATNLQHDLATFGSPEEITVERLHSQVLRAPHLAGMMARVFVRRAHDEGAQVLDPLIPSLSVYPQHATDDESRALVEAMCQSPQFWGRFESAPNASVWSVIQVLRDHGLATTDEAKTAIHSHLAQVQPNEWWTVVLDGGPPLDALVAMTEVVELPALMSALATGINALPAHSQALAKWALAMRRLRWTDQDALIEQLAPAILTPPFGHLAATALIHAPELASTPAFRDAPDAALLQVGPQLIGHTAAIDDVLRAAEQLTPLIHRANADTLESLRQVLVQFRATPLLHDKAIAIWALWAQALDPLPSQ